jgi:hypothetical protein
VNDESLLEVAAEVGGKVSRPLKRLGSAETEDVIMGAMSDARTRRGEAAALERQKRWQKLSAIRSIGFYEL